MRVAVAGGTGVVGRHVVAALRHTGHETVVLARATGVDLRTGDGLDAALAGVEVVVDCSNVATLSRSRSAEFFTAATRHLLEAGDRAGVRHHVVLSIVGIDDVDFGYYEGKRRQEQLVRGGSLPFTVLRATQFYEFPGQILAQGRGPVGVVPKMLVQPVAAAEVGARLAELAAGPALGTAPEMAGPDVHELVPLARRVAERRGSPRRVVGLAMPGKVGRAMAGGGLLPRGEPTLGRVTFEEWLADATF